MSNQTIVSVYSIRVGGVTGAWRGSGSLVDPLLVLLHQPLSDEIIKGQPLERLRVAIAPLVEGTSLIEVTDADVRIVSGDEVTGPLVALELDRPASSPLDVVQGLHDVKDASTLMVASAGHLARLPRGVGPPPHTTPRSPWCKWLGVGCPP